jgi:hypothetical protein
MRQQNFQTWRLRLPRLFFVPGKVLRFTLRA